MFKAKRIEIDAANEYVAILMRQKAKELSLHARDRIKIINKKNNRSILCVLEIDDVDVKTNTFDKKRIKCRFKNNEIGIFEKAFDKLGLIENEKVDIVPAKRPSSLEHVKEKSKGKRLSEKQFLDIMVDIVENRYSDIETTFFVISCTINPLNDSETVGLTNAMVNVGQRLEFKCEKGDVIADKHCIGGIPGNRTSMIVVPIVAACGVKIPKSSSRSITSPAGTADTMEVLARVDLEIPRMYKEVNELNGCIVWGGGLDLSPADDLIIHVEHPLEIDSQGQMIASILSKKKSAGATDVLIDIPIGKTAKVNSHSHANQLRRKFEKIGKAVGMNIRVIITNGEQPIGNGIGPLLEAKDVLMVLKNEIGMPVDLKEKSVRMAGHILEMAGKTGRGKGYDLAKHVLESGMAYEKFEQIRKFQGKKRLIQEAKYKYSVTAKKTGKIREINNKKISKLAFILGAPNDKAAGLYLHKKVGEKVSKGEVLYEMFSNSELKLKYGKAYLKDDHIYNI